MPGKKALVVTSNGQSTKKFGYLAAVEHELEQAGVAHVLFDEVRPNTTRENVMDASRKARSSNPYYLFFSLRTIDCQAFSICSPDMSG